MAYVLGSGIGPRIAYDPKVAAQNAARLQQQTQRLQNLVINRAITLPPTPEEMARAVWGRLSGHYIAKP